ncbi:MAG: UPF0104 family protein [Chloroflexi bacterium]|nr:MAG: UPF0104 family protein [Chloroflexota bacterium]
MLSPPCGSAWRRRAAGRSGEAAEVAGEPRTGAATSSRLGWVKAALSLGLLIFLVTRVDVRATAEAFRGARWWYLMAALALYLAGVPLRAYRWQGLLSALHVAVPLRRLVSLYFVGTFFNNILPTGVGGDVVRAYELSKDGAGAAAAASTVLVDRAAGLLVLLAVALISTLFSFRMIDLNLALVIAGISLGSFAGVAVLLWDDLWRKVARHLPALRRLLARRGLEAFYRSLQVYRGRAVVKALVLSFIFNVVLIAVNYLIALSMGVNISLWYFLLFIPLISFSLILPVSVSGLGVREGAYVLLFGQAGVTAPLALAMSFAFYALNVATGLIGGVIYALQGLGWWTSSSGRG